MRQLELITKARRNKNTVLRGFGKSDLVQPANGNLYNLKRRLCPAVCLFAMAFSSCSDTDMDLTSDIDLIKSYGDTAANVDNAFTKIVAGSNRLYMIYGVSSYAFYFNNSMNMTPANSRIMATDNSGNLIWKRDLPEDLTTGSVVELSDGGCLAALGTFFGTNPALFNGNIYLIRYDKKGNVIMNDSVSLIPTLQTQYWYPIDLDILKTTSGKIIVYGDMDGDLGLKSYAFEYSPGGGVQWFKVFHYPPNASTTQLLWLTGCIETPDQGLLFAGVQANLTTPGLNGVAKPILIRTNSFGDTLWTKHCNLEGNAYSFWSRNIISAPGGNYRFCFNENADAAYYGGVSKTHIYEVNANGDSSRDVVVGNLDANMGFSIAESADGGCRALVNRHAQYINQNFDGLLKQVNTRDVRFDASMVKLHDAPFQTLSTDIYFSNCKTSDGRIASFGMMQPVGKTYYVPQLVIFN